MGTSFFAVSVLKSLYQNGYPISVVYTQPAQKSKRGQRVNKSPIQSISETLNIEFRNPTSLKNNKEEYEYLKKLDPSISIVADFGQIIPKEILSLTKKGFINIHASLLPRYRSAAPIQRSIMNLDKQTGISIMKIDEKLDTGPICNSYPLNILENENSESLSERLSLFAAEKILDNIDAILEDKAVFKPQDDAKATYANKILKFEARIDWSESARNIIGKINGVWPNSFFIYKGHRYKLLKAEPSSKIGEAGDVLSDNLDIACKEGSIKVLEIQKEGKRPQKINEFMHGSQIKKGSNLNNA